MDRSSSDAPGTNIPLKTLPNLRDLGGWPTRDSRRVKRGLLFRSVELYRLDDDDVLRLGDLGIKTVYDLRTEAERIAQPDRLPAGAEGVVADVLADMTRAAPADLTRLVSDPEEAKKLLADGKAKELFLGAYRDIVSLPSALAAYRELFTGLLEPQHRPALFHCTTGKDRAGWGAASFLSIMGVDRELVFQDYLLTNEQLLPALEPVFAAFESKGGDRELLIPVLGVDRSYLEASFDELDAKFGSIEGYFSEGLGIDAGSQERLRDSYLEPAG